MTTAQNSVFKAHVVFATTNDGGRKSAIWSGYRPQFFFDREDYESTMMVDSGNCIEPGGDADVTITLSVNSSEMTRGRIHRANVFELREGARSVAGGIVTEILVP